MYECLRCGEKSDINDLSCCYVFMGEYCGEQAFKTEICCPICGYDVEYRDGSVQDGR